VFAAFRGCVITPASAELCCKTSFVPSMGAVDHGSASLLARGFITRGNTAAYHRGGLHSAEINNGASRQELMPVIKPIACSHRYSEKKIFCMWNLEKEL